MGMSEQPNITAALSEWRSALGEDAVRGDDATRDKYARTTLVHGHAPGAVVYPCDTAQVQAVVRIAAKHRVPLYPISKGRNLGYGDRTAPTPGQVVVDLGRMNRIVEVNEQLAYAVIEPGVTQGQLHEHLRKKHPNLWMDATGAGLEASIVGNTVDRGFGHTPAGDHFHNSCGLEVVLADGEVVHTGFGHFAKPQAAHVYPYGVGPVLDGIFSQSNLGIVTRAGVWLNPRPAAFLAFFASAPRKQDLPQLIDRLTPLRLAGLVRSGVHVANDVRVMSARIRYPFDQTGGKTLMSDAVRAKIAQRLDIGAWNVSGGIYGTRKTVVATRAAVRAALRGFRVVFLNDRKLKLAQRAVFGAHKIGLGGWKLAELLKVVEPAYGLLKGVPSDEFLRGALWQSKAKTDSLDPLDHNVGLIWVSPVAPASGRHAEEITRIAEPIYHKHGFDFLITFTIITERSLACVTNLTFDRANEGDCKRAAACYDELMSALLGAGYPPYRTGPTGFAKLRAGEASFWETCEKLKAALDPHNIIAPGRYI